MVVFFSYLVFVDPFKILNMPHTSNSTDVANVYAIRTGVKVWTSVQPPGQKHICVLVQLLGPLHTQKKRQTLS